MVRSYQVSIHQLNKVLALVGTRNGSKTLLDAHHTRVGDTFELILVFKDSFAGPSRFKAFGLINCDWDVIYNLRPLSKAE